VESSEEDNDGYVGIRELHTTYGGMQVVRFNKDINQQFLPQASRFAPLRGDGSRILLWHAPLRLPLRSEPGYQRKLRERLDNCGEAHPRRAQVLADDTTLSRYTARLHNETIHAHIRNKEAVCHLLMGCSWCGIPCGGWCEGFNMEFMVWPPDDSRYYIGHWSCGRSVCSGCERIFGTCPLCSMWVGLPAAEAGPAGEAGSTSTAHDEQVKIWSSSHSPSVHAGAGYPNRW